MPDTEQTNALRKALRPFAEEIVCTCHEAYRERELADPQCAYHEWEEEVAAARAALAASPPVGEERHRFELIPPSADTAGYVREGIEAFRGAHYINLYVRKNGRDIHQEGDWLKYLREVGVPTIEEQARKSVAALPVPPQDDALLRAALQDEILRTFGGYADMADLDGFVAIFRDALAARAPHSPTPTEEVEA